MKDLRQAVTISLTEPELLELQRILIDDDAESALVLWQTIAQRLPQKNSRPCNSNNLNNYLLPG